MRNDKFVPEKWQKLTKKFYMQLTTGLYLVSSICRTPSQPIYSGRVAGPARRERQWKKIVKCGVSQRMCLVFNDEKEHRNWVKQVLKHSVRQP